MNMSSDWEETVIIPKKQYRVHPQSLVKESVVRQLI